MEEWWGRTFEGRGTVHLSSMPDSKPETIRRLSTMALHELVVSERNQSARSTYAQAELRRRENWTGRVALIVSILALIVAALRP